MIDELILIFYVRGHFEHTTVVHVCIVSNDWRKGRSDQRLADFRLSMYFYELNKFFRNKAVTDKYFLTIEHCTRPARLGDTLQTLMI